MATKALIIDDEEDYRVIISEVLRGAGYEVRAGKDGSEGLDLLKQAAPDVVLVDWMMPKMDGEQFCRAMRALGDFKDIPVIMLTSSAGDPTRATHRPDAVVRKADGLELLLSSLKDVIGKFELSPS